MKSQRTTVDTTTGMPANYMTPTEMVRSFRESILRGEVRLPFSEGVTVEQRDALTRKLRERVGLAS